ncbi:hypothetical protein [Salinisphaera sp. LB1]|uniref:hypothetical protein n=1 Tax=Salinisphaera sp. LB1 TaxID=2183911 RepID=UPI000D706A39|nr:hypothetical protein [Salinisphaera sp. LB1]AWN17925.1 hypothetical protein SALB1_3733 [Salinisphaera sp. LB1]
MTWPGLAIAVHLLAVLWWIGGLAFVTLVLLPALRAEFNDQSHALLSAIERRFAPQARLAVVLVGASGIYLLWAFDLWRVLGQLSFWWLDAMIGYWLVFAMILFVIEPLGVLQRLIFVGQDPAIAWRRFHALHAVLLGLAVIIIAAATAGSHGF